MIPLRSIRCDSKRCGESAAAVPTPTLDEIKHNAENKQNAESKIRLMTRSADLSQRGRKVWVCDVIMSRLFSRVSMALGGVAGVHSRFVIGRLSPHNEKTLRNRYSFTFRHPFASVGFRSHRLSAGIDGPGRQRD